MVKQKITKKKYTVIRMKGKDYLKLRTPHGPTLITEGTLKRGLKRYDESQKPYYKITSGPKRR